LEISTTPAANFATSSAGVVDTGVNDTGGKFATGVNNNCRKKFIYMLTLLPKVVKKIMKTFLIEEFFHLPLVSTTPVVHLEL
jgi:hypothetical protein